MAVSPKHSKNDRRRHPPQLEPPAIVTLYQNGNLLKLLVGLIATLLFLRLWVADLRMTALGGGGENSSNIDDEDYHSLYVSKKKDQDRCLDDDDPPEWKKAVPEKRDCQCPDPFQAKKRPGEAAWDARHAKLVGDVEYANALALETGIPLDVVILGDSLTERWNGTKNVGRVPLPENRVIFEKYFGKTNAEKSTAPFNGIALGTAGDLSVHLLWHLENGMLPTDARPTVFLILIGTNDLGSSGCSKRTAFAGIVEVAHRVRRKRPHAPILLHGLLPRSDSWGKQDYTLNRHWKDILWINRELKKHASLRENWYYMEAGDLFLQRMRDEEHPEGDAKGAVVINPNLMGDGLHPDAAGYDLWGARIVEHVQKVIANYKTHDH